MRKTSTAATASNKNLHRKLTIGLDLGDRSSWYCVLDEADEVIGEQKLSTTLESDERSNCGYAVQPVGTGDRDALAVGKPVVERAGT